MSKKDYRRHIGLVLQDVFLMAGDIATNIRMWNERVSDERVREIARYVQADSFIDKLPGGYDHVLRSGGGTLSSGERQLISFARALTQDPEILVMDEATANIDTNTEILIQEALLRLQQNRTTIAVAHACPRSRTPTAYSLSTRAGSVNLAATTSSWSTGGFIIIWCSCSTTEPRNRDSRRSGRRGQPDHRETRLKCRVKVVLVWLGIDRSDRQRPKKPSPSQEPQKRTTSSRKKNRRLSLSSLSNSPQLLNMITNSRKKNSRLLSVSSARRCKSIRGTSFYRISPLTVHI